MPSDLSTAARTPQDQEFTYYAVGMVAGAIPGIVVGFIVAAFVGHAAMWLSVFGGVGIIIGLVVATVLFRRRRAATRAAQPTSSAAPGDDAADRRS